MCLTECNTFYGQDLSTKKLSTYMDIPVVMQMFKYSVPLCTDNAEKHLKTYIL